MLSAETDDVPAGGLIFQSGMLSRIVSKNYSLFTLNTIYRLKRFPAPSPTKSSKTEMRVGSHIWSLGFIAGGFFFF